jgi:GT2 family glycosyltransferase
MILMYHKVALESPTVWWVTADAFWRQMEQLTRYDVVSLSQYDPANPRHVVITFDGAYENVHTYAFPILKRFGYPFELFVVGDLIGQGNEFDQPTEPPARFATADQLKAMVRGGGRLQWHTKTHPDLATLDQASLDRELTVPADIRSLEPAGFRWLAYPHGRNPDHVIDRVRAGFDGALSCVDGRDDDRHQWNRLTVTNKTSFAKSTVSLIIPSYNYGRFAAEAIESALAQTVPPKEILFIDDCSDDNSIEVAKRYQDRIKVVRNEKNLGIVENFNKAVSLTSGDYICFLGADNRFRSDYVEHCQRLLDQHPDVAVVYTNVVFFGPRAEVMAIKLKIPAVPNTTDMFLWRLPEFNEETKALLDVGNCIHGSSMYRRQAYEDVGGYRKGNRQEDQNLFHRMIKKGWGAVLCPEFLLEYRQHSTQQADTQFNSGLEVVHLRQENAGLAARKRELESQLRDIQGSFGWRLGSRIERLVDKVAPVGTRRRKAGLRFLRVIRVLRHEGLTGFLKRLRNQIYHGDFSKNLLYELWMLRHEPTKAQLDVMRKEAQAFPYRPKVSIVTPVYNPNRYDLTQCIQSVVDQFYDNWELCLVDGASDKPYVREVIEGFAARDSRIKYVSLQKNLGIVGNSNEARAIATGEYVALLDHDDALAPFALSEVVGELNRNPQIDCFYSDEDKVTANGKKRYDPAFKPDWSPDTFLSINYVCHFTVIRKKILDEVGWFRSGYDGSQDYDLFLRVSEKTDRIKRIPKVLYHWRAAAASVASNPHVKPYAYVAAKKALADHLRRKGVEAEVLDGAFTGSYRIKYRVRPLQRVTIIVPTKDRLALLKQCVSSVLAKTAHKDFEILIIDNQSEEPETLRYFEEVAEDRRVKVARYDQPFNFSAINNYAVRLADSEHVLFLNNDTEVINPDWLAAMLEYSQRKDVGAVGARLYFPDKTIQHAGVILGLGGVAAHAHRDDPESSHGYMGRIKIVQNLSAVTAACLMMRREVFDEVGGFDEGLAHAFNDVNLCLKIRDKGYLIVYTPYAELYHHESASRGSEDTPERKARFAKEVEIVKTRWKHVLEAGDPYYNPNLTLEKPDFSVRL